MNQNLPFVTNSNRQLYLMKLVFLTMFALATVACTDPSNLNSYVDTWVSGFGDTDEYGNEVDRAWLLTIDSNHSFTLQYQDDSTESWQEYTSGKIKIITINNSGVRQPGIQIGTGGGCLYAGGLDVTVGGELRTFNRSGILRGIVVWAIIFLAFIIWATKDLWEEHQNYKILVSTIRKMITHKS